MLRHVEIDKIAKVMKHVDSGVEFDEKSGFGDSQLAPLFRLRRFKVQRGIGLEFGEPRLKRRLVIRLRRQQIRVQIARSTYLSFSKHVFPESVRLVRGSSRSQLPQIEVKMTSLAIAQVLRAAQRRVTFRARSTNGHHLVEPLPNVAKITVLEKLFSLIFFGRRPRSGVSLAADGREKSIVRIETMRLVAPTNAAFGRIGTCRRRRGRTIRVSEMRM